MSYPVNIRKLSWREVSGVLHSARALGLSYHIEVLHPLGEAAMYRMTCAGVLLYQGFDMDDARAAADAHFTRAVGEVLE